MSDTSLPFLRARRRSWEHGQWALKPALERTERRDKTFIRWIEETAAIGIARLRPTRFGLRAFARKVVAQEGVFSDQSNMEIAAEIEQLRASLRSAPDTHAHVVHAFALIREVTFRKLNMRHYPSQIMAGRVLHDGIVAQLATGEGKTITGLLPTITAALSGLPVHVVTVNPYLAARDCETLRPVIETFGLSVGLIDADMSPDEKRSAYACDVVFVTNKDLCFDYLRDIDARGSSHSHARRLLSQIGRSDIAPGPKPMMRGLHFALLDEVDLVLVDEARIPLVISGPRGDVENEADFERALGVAKRLNDRQHFKLLRVRRAAELTQAGKDEVKRITAHDGGLWVAERARVERVEQALAALHIYARDHDYVIAKDDTIQIVDPHTGRISPGRAWERGLHQLIEMKEGVPLTGRSDTSAKITYQRFFRRYMKLAGMTGTAQGLSTEFWRVFGLRIVKIPTHRPIQRRDRPSRLYAQADVRWQDAASCATEVIARGAATLVGTLAVESSELMAEKLQGMGLHPNVLNATQDAEEAAVVAKAGAPGALTIATSMAGRGTDIGLDPAVKEAGGLHVLVTEPSESRRVDLQLMGRAGRQGDPGETQSFLCLEDDLFATYIPRTARALRRIMALLRLRCLVGFPARLVLWSAQAAAERRNARLRRATVKSDRDLLNMLGFAGRSE